MRQEVRTWAEVNAPISYGNYTGALASGDQKRAKRIEKHIRKKYKEETKGGFNNDGNELFRM